MSKLPRRARTGKRHIPTAIRRHDAVRLKAIKAGPRMPPDERRLLVLCGQIEALTLTAQMLLGSGPSPEREAELAKIRPTIEAMAMAARGIKPDEGGSYPNARMMFVDLVLELAKGIANIGDNLLAEELAPQIVEELLLHYPDLAPHMRDPERLSKIGSAIVRCVGSPDWQALVACWEGIEARKRKSEDRDAYTPDSWRRQYARWLAERRPQDE